jgi:type I restriction-modification system DNA methylase subunit
MQLFNAKTVKSVLGARQAPSAAALDRAREWAMRATDQGLDLQNESQLEQEFNRIVVQDVLGYAAPAPGIAGTMRVKQPIPGGTIVDLALGHFGEGEDRVVAPFELKGPKVALDRIMPGRAKTPVQQAWDYAMDAPGARWVLVCNMKELRLYAVGHGRQTYESFDLKRLTDADEVARLVLLLHADNLLGGSTKHLLDQSAAADREITNKLYADYKALRANLMAFVAAQHPCIGVEDRIRIVQTLLDRLLFIAFAEDKHLLPQNSLRDAVGFVNRYDPKLKWFQLRTLFGWVDEGAPPHNIPRYNGGLFRADPLIDGVDGIGGLDLPDHLVEELGALAEYDFASDVSVTILGHIFEQSITDIENEKAQAGLEAPPPTTKKKREGVVYTPDFIARFIVESTIGKHLEEIADALLPQFGKREADGEIRWKNAKTAEGDYWSAYLDSIGALRILDPACGSGAFLIAAFNFLNAEQKRVRDRLSELRPGILTHLSPNADVGIITNNLFGVDVNAESVEITKLALWLQTAKRDRALESLDDNIQHGNSLVDDAAYHPRPFDWNTRFGTLGDDNRFDIVLGNPPYVRMELLKKEKPHFEKRFEVVTDRADLYAYFFELGVKLLRPGGRLGYISSSTFFRTGSGSKLRTYLAGQAQIERVVDFGDLQVFEGVTTYPAIVTLRKGEAGEVGDLAYLNVRAVPDDLAKTFEQEALPMPRARLGSGTWRFESDLLDAIRRKMAAGRQTLAEVYGAPLYGIKTGLNDAFELTREERDAIVARAARTPGDRSAELLKPFLVGEDLKRWHVESADRWLIYIPKNTIDIDDYPAVRDHLLPFRARLEKRATLQNWWELQQAQANYVPHFESQKTIWPHFQSRGSFSVEDVPHHLNNKCFFWPGQNFGLAAYLNSTLSWFVLTSVARTKRGGFIEAEAQYVGTLPMPDDLNELEPFGREATAAATDLHGLTVRVRHRLGDLHPDVRTGAALEKWHTMSFDELKAILLKRFKMTIPVRERDEWESWFDAQRAEATALRRQITNAEAEIDARVYALFGLTPTEIAAVEEAVAIASPTVSLKASEAISAVEGLALSDDARQRLAVAA